MLAALVAPAWLVAVSVPNSFADGAVAQAAEVNQNFDALESALNEAAPSGTISAFGGSAAPAGWRLCDGSTVSRTTYAELFAAIGTAWGNGDGSTTFNLPDLRGRFLRGVAGGTGRDPDSGSRTVTNAGGNTGDAVGSFQDHSFQSHNHSVSVRINGSIGGFDGNDRPANAGGGGPQFGTKSVQGPTTGNFGSETRPENVYVHYIIKE